MNRVHTDAIIGWKLKEFAGNGRILRRIGKPISSEEQRGEDDGCDDVGATPRLFLPLILNYVRPSMGCHSICFTASQAGKRPTEE